MGNQLLKVSALGVVLTSLLFFAADSSGAIIVFKDGFTLNGQVRDPKKFTVEGGVTIALPAGFMYIDDNVRRVVFVPTGGQIIDVIKPDPILEKDRIILQQLGVKKQRPSPLPGWTFEKATEFDSEWKRTLTMSSDRGPIYMKEKILALSPKFIYIQSMTHNWDLFYHPKEYGLELMRSLLVKWYQKKTDMSPVQKQMAIYQFMFQAGWYDQAERELDSEVLSGAPGLSLAPEREKLKKVRANLLAEEIERLQRAGQHKAAQGRLEDFFKKKGQGQQAWTQAGLARNAAPAEELREKYEKAREQLKQAAELFVSLPPGVGNTPESLALSKAADELATNLGFDSIDRLETFNLFGKQHLSEVKSGKAPEHSPEQMLALAITGWLRGNGGAEPDVKAASALWKARQMLLDFQKGDVAAGDIESHCTKYNITADLLAQLITTLPPALADDTIKALTPTKIKAKTGEEYWVQLPPEYNPNRSYPVLIALHGAEEKPQAMLDRWTLGEGKDRASGLAAKHGFIVAAPAWGKGAYQYSAAEHEIVLNCLRDLRKRFAVDSDRAFLFGWGQGGNMALDVGLSHPDQFAGVLPQNASPRFYPERYWPNAQYLNFYVLGGDSNGANPKDTREKLFNHWIRWQYPAMYFEYKGRGHEWFPTELPVMFDWMSRKKRSHPMRELGRINHTNPANSEVFKTHRAGDNRFYWLTTEGIEGRCINNFKAWVHTTTPASLHATIRTGTQLDIKVDKKDPKVGIAEKAKIWNHIYVSTTGVKQVSILLGPNMLNFKEDVIVVHNGKQVGNKKKIQPSIATMLEDFYIQGDRTLQRLVYARIDLKW